MQSPIAKKVLAVHGRASDITKQSWQIRKQAFSDAGIDLDLFQFDMAEDPSYESWETTFKSIDFSKYDAIYTSSLGGLMTLRYMHENNLSIRRLVMAVPGISLSTLEGKKPNIAQIYEDFGTPNLSHIADETFVISTQDDDIVPYQSGQKIAQMVGAECILLEDGGHSLKGHLDTIVSLVKYGKQL